MDFLVEFFIDLFGNINKELVIFIISLLPILELRGGLLAATLLEVEFVRAAIICILGNVLPIPIVLLFLKYVLDVLSKWDVTKKLRQLVQENNTADFILTNGVKVLIKRVKFEQFIDSVSCL